MVLLTRIHWIFGGVVSGHDVCWASWTRQDWQKGLCGHSVSLPGMVPEEGWIEEWTSKITPTSTCLHPAHCAGLLGLSRKRQSSSWMVLSGFPVSAVATLTQWSLGDTRKTRTTVRERDEWDCINHTFTVRGGSSKNDLTCKNRCDFFFFNLVGVFSTSVLNHLSASLVQVCRRNACGMSDVELCAILPRALPGVLGMWGRTLSWKDWTTLAGWKDDLGYIQTITYKRLINRVPRSVVCQVDR